MKLIDLMEKVSFEAMWERMVAFYPEDAFLQSKYRKMCETIVAERAKCETLRGDIVVRVLPLSDCDEVVMVHGVEFPVETLADREVVIEREEKIADADLLAHILYGVATHGYVSSAQYMNRVQQYLESISDTCFRVKDDWLEADDDSISHWKLIFLDIDGVLNTSHYMTLCRLEGRPDRDKYGPLFDPQAVENLRRIIDATRAEIVITSSWRYILGVDVLRQMWAERGLPGKIYGVTSMDMSGSRGDEVEAFLKGAFGNCKNDYLILDDECDYGERLQERMIVLDPMRGLKSSDVERSLEILSLNEQKYSAIANKEIEEERVQRELEKKSSYRHKMRFWAGVFFDDAPFDYCFLLMVIKRKLEFDIGYYQRYAMLERGSNIAVDMKRCVCLIDVMIDESHGDKVRRDKALKLLCKMLEYKIWSWWD